jgi:hypothetical protein
LRAKDFLIVESYEDLFEVKMSPSNLKKLASDIDAKVGIEFEMIVPNVGTVDDDADPEEDMSMDEDAYDIDDIIRFFDDGEYNYGSAINDLRNELQEKFYEYQSEQIDDLWSQESGEYFTKWCRENVSDDEVADYVGTEEDLLGDRVPSKEDWEKFIEDEWEEQGYNYSKAYEEFRDEKQEEGDFDERQFLNSIGIYNMSDVPGATSGYIMWPYYTGGDSEMNLEQVASEFSRAVGMHANYSTSYHGGNREDDAYDIEPDSSLHGEGGDTGLEFISPPLSLDQAVEQVKLVKKWADGRGAYTNRSTGLHMNVSVPDFDQDKLDFVKLTLLLGDKYLLDRFGRSANTYCKSAMDVIADASPQDKELLFKKLKNNLEEMASKVIHSGRVGKFTSINPKDNRVEFRGPGGDWLGDNFDKVEDTLYRCVVALDAAVDPDKYRKEYLKKLTKMFAPTKGSIEDIFVQYAAGTITRSELKNKLKTAQAERKQSKYTAQGIIEVPIYQARDGDWIVEYDNPTGDNRRIILKRTEQVSNDDKALQAAVKLEPSWFKPDDIENILVTEFTGNHYYIVHGDDPDKRVEIYAFSPMQAVEIAVDMYPNMVNQGELTARLKDEFEEPQQSSPRMAPGEQLYIVRNNDTGHEVRLAAGSEQNARGRAIRNDPHNFTSGADITVTPVSLQTGAEPSSDLGQEYQLYRVTGQTQPYVTASEYIAARSVSEANRIAMTLYPNLYRVQEPDIVLQDSDRSTVSMYQARQAQQIERMNEPSQSSDWRDRLRGHLGQAQPAFGGSDEDNTFGSWVVSNSRTGETINVMANNEQHARDRAESHRPMWSQQDLEVRRQHQPSSSSGMNVYTITTTSGRQINLLGYDRDHAATRAIEMEPGLSGNIVDVNLATD